MFSNWNLFKKAHGTLYAADRVLARLTRSLRAARYARRSAPFIHYAERNLLFELYPGEEIDREIAINGIYERRYLRFLESLIPDQAVILDIGANIGNHALYWSRKAAAIHCFEPNPRAWQRLERNVALNNATNITVHRYGLGEISHVERFTEISGNLGMTRPAADGDLHLEIKQADRAISLARIDFIKIDVEGQEASVFAGLRRTIAQHRPIIAFEFSGHKWPTIAAALPGYTIAEPIFARGLKLLTQGEVPELKFIPEPEPRWYEGLIAFP